LTTPDAKDNLRESNQDMMRVGEMREYSVKEDTPKTPTCCRQGAERYIYSEIKKSRCNQRKRQYVRIAKYSDTCISMEYGEKEKKRRVEVRLR
jgi:hypothetical protein